VRQSQLLTYIRAALPPKADIVQHGGNVRFVPQGDIGRGLFDHFIGKPKNRRWYFKTDGFRGLQIYHEQLVCWFLERQIGRIRTFENPINQ